MPNSGSPTVVAEVGFEARYLWVNIEGGDAPKINSVSYIPLAAMKVPLTPALAYPFTTPFIEHKHLKIPSNADTLEYAPAGKCIYCGTSKYSEALERRLGEEHIIAGGLGSSVILVRSTKE
jgi:hypothetical protein